MTKYSRLKFCRTIDGFYNTLLRFEYWHVDDTVTTCIFSKLDPIHTGLAFTVHTTRLTQRIIRAFRRRGGI